MSAPTLSTTQKENLYKLMKAYLTAASSTFEYVGAARRESYATVAKTNTSTPLNGCMNSSAGKYFLNCGLFAQMIWMGRNISDFTSHTTAPVKTISKAFTWGYYFDFLPCRNAYGKTNTDTNAKYSGNTYTNAAGKQVFITFDNAASMAQELYEKGYEIPYSEADVGDMVFYRSDSIVDGDTDQLENASFRFITHVGLVYDITADGVPIILECTNAYSNKVMGKCGISKNDGAQYSVTKPSHPFGNVRGANLGYRNVMCARHPATFGHTGNVPSSFAAYRGADE